MNQLSTNDKSLSYDDDFDNDAEHNAELLERLLQNVKQSIESDNDSEDPEIRVQSGFSVKASNEQRDVAPAYSKPTHTAFSYPASTLLAGQAPPSYGTPYTYYGNIPSQPPPSFAEAVAGTPPTQATRHSYDNTPNTAHYVPPLPAPPPDTILLRNSNGVFLLQPIVKPTPPYTPSHVQQRHSPPLSPLPRYSLPPAAAVPGADLPFLGHAALSGGPVDPPQYSEAIRSNTSPYMGSYTAGSMNNMTNHLNPNRSPLYSTAPPPYSQ